MSAITKTTKGVMKSANFNIQAIMLLLFAVLEFFGFPIEVAEEIRLFIEAILLSGVGFIGFIRAWIAKGIKGEYTSNVLTYVFAAIGGLVGWFGAYSSELEGVIAQLIEVLTAGDINLIFPVLFSVGTIVLRIFRDKPWQTRVVIDTDSDKGSDPIETT